MRKVWLNKMLVLPNVIMKLSNVRKKKREPLNLTKVQLNMMLVLHNLRVVLSNVRKKILVQLNVAKVRLNVKLVLSNVTMKPSNVRKNKGTTECDKSIVICDVGTAQCEKKKK